MKRLCTTSCLVSPQMVFLLKFGGELTSCITVLRTIGIPFLGNIHVWQFPALCRHYLCLVVQQNFAYIYTSGIYLLVIIYSRYLSSYMRTLFFFSLLIFTRLFPCMLLLLPLLLLFFHMHLPLLIQIIVHFSFIGNHFFLSLTKFKGKCNICNINLFS